MKKFFLSIVLVLVFPVMIFAGEVIGLKLEKGKGTATAIPMECNEGKMLAVTNHHVVEHAVKGTANIIGETDNTKGMSFEVVFYGTYDKDTAFIEIDISKKPKNFCKRVLFNFDIQKTLEKDATAIILDVNSRGKLINIKKNEEVVDFLKLPKPNGKLSSVEFMLTDNNIAIRHGDSGSALVDRKNKNSIIGMCSGETKFSKNGKEFARYVHVNDILSEYEKIEKNKEKNEEKKAKKSIMDNVFFGK